MAAVRRRMFGSSRPLNERKLALISHRAHSWKTPKIRVLPCTCRPWSRPQCWGRFGGAQYHTRFKRTISVTSPLGAIIMQRLQKFLNSAT